MRVTSSVIMKSDGNFWYVKDKDSGKWGLPGGRRESGESAEQTARRETYQETGFIVKLKYIVGIYQFNNSHGQDVFNVVYKGEIIRGKPKISRPKEISEIKLLDYEKILAFYRKGKLRVPRVNMRSIMDYRSGRRHSLDILINLMRK